MIKVTLLTLSSLVVLSCLLPESAEAHYRSHRHRHGNRVHRGHHGPRKVCELRRDRYYGGWYEQCYIVGGPRSVYEPTYIPTAPPVNLIFSF